jgi:hypothetical protein
MKDVNRVALFGHAKCRSKFFAELHAEIAPQYRGTCPNPSCNRHVVLFPEVLFHSTDKARREYIKRSQGEPGPIYWQA